MIRAVNSQNWKSIILGLIVLVFEAIVLLAFLHEFLSIYLLISIHACVIFILGSFARLSFQKNEDLRYPLLLLLSTLGAGPFGTAAFLLMALLRPLFALISVLPEKWFEGLFPEQTLTPFSRIFLRIKSGWDDYGLLAEVASFKDIFKFGTLLEKQAVLDAIVKDFNPIYAPILQGALVDPHNSVRIQAAAIVSKIDFDFDKSLMKIIAAEKENPHNPKTQLMLATHYDQYLSLGILDMARRHAIGDLAIKSYQEYLKSKPDDRSTWFAIGRILYHQNDFESYINWYQEYREKFKIVPDIVVSWYQEALYRMHRYEELADATRGY